MSETVSEKKRRALQIYEILKNTYPDAKCALNFNSVFQLLVAVILSAQCTDTQVNKITPRLFSLLPDAEAFAKADLGTIETLIHSTGFYRNKAKNVQGAAKMIVEKYEGKVPNTLAEMIKLPGAGRKTANVVLETGFGKVEGIVVDTHVMRITKLLKFVSKNAEENAVKIEKELMELFPYKKWGKLAHILVHHGRSICVARRPKCYECPIAPFCPGRKL